MNKAVIHSPESTVTSLLASSGHLKSSVYTDSSHSSIKYNDRHYESATEALDAYIEDFEKSLGSSWKSTGRLHLKRNTVSHPRAQFKNRDDDKIELLILKAEKALSSPALGLGRSVREHGSPQTEEVLEADRSWDNPPAVTCSSGYSSSKHHGPVEALKQMLFSLQSVEQRFSQEQIDQHEEITAIKQV
ncbi:UNVERIFIED_CONTAM: hypothetical protein FKN15_000721 [Acipenser sinensis]